MDAKSSLIQPTFLFDDRKRFDAQCDHDKLRSSIQSDIDIPQTADPWKQRPVDFTLKNFHPNRKKQRNLSSSSIEDNLPKEKSSEFSRIHNPIVMQPFKGSYQNKNSKNTNDEMTEFIPNPKIKYEKVKRMLNTEPYKNPQPHDFRQVEILFYYSKSLFSFFTQYPSIKELGLSEFQTAYDHDPYNIHFLSDHLNTCKYYEKNIFFILL